MGSDKLDFLASLGVNKAEAPAPGSAATSATSLDNQQQSTRSGLTVTSYAGSNSGGSPLRRADDDYKPDLSGVVKGNAAQHG